MLDSPCKAYSREPYSIKKQSYKKGTLGDSSTAYSDHSVVYSRDVRYEKIPVSVYRKKYTGILAL